MQTLSQGDQILCPKIAIAACLAGAYVVNQRKRIKSHILLLSFINHLVILIISAHVMKKSIVTIF